MSEAVELDELYRQAARETARGSKSFYFATRFFPPELARASHAVYWFCRHTDDLVDECPSIDEGRRDLEAWADALASRHDHPVLKVFLDTADRYEIPLEYAFELIEGMRMDLNRTRYRTFDELRIFCYRVASVVGLMMSWVIGFESPSDRERALPHAIDLGIAMQLTNILRDVGEDLGRDRIYLPQEDMERFGYSDADLRARVRNEGFRAIMRFEAERAKGYYGQGNAGIQMLNRRGRFAVKIASDVYRQILAQLESSNFDVFEKRAVVSTAQKYWLTARNLAIPAAHQCAAKLALWRTGFWQSR